MDLWWQRNDEGKDTGRNRSKEKATLVGDSILKEKENPWGETPAREIRNKSKKEGKNNREKKDIANN